MITSTPKRYIKAKFHTRKGCLEKRWYIEFQAWDTKTDSLKIKQVFCPARFTTPAQRHLWAEENIVKINSLLVSGGQFKATDEQPVPPRRLEYSINQVFDLAIKKAESLRPKTLSTYKGILNQFRNYLGNKAKKGIDYITKTLVSEYQDYLLSNDLSAVTINNTCNVIRIMINKAVKADYIKINPFVYQKLTETESYSNVAFTPEHQRLIEDYLKENNYPLYVFTRVMYYNFLRPKELKGTKVGDVDFIGRSVTVLGYVAKNRKTNTIPLHPLLYDLINEYRHYPPKFYLVGKHFKPGQLQLASNAAYEAHKAALRAVGLYDVYEYTLYSWRHTGAVNAYLAGTDIKTLQYLFRHSSVTHTEIYLKSLKLQLRKVDLKNW